MKAKKKYIIIAVIILVVIVIYYMYKKKSAATTTVGSVLTGTAVSITPDLAATTLAPSSPDQMSALALNGGIASGTLRQMNISPQ